MGSGARLVKNDCGLSHMGKGSFIVNSMINWMGITSLYLCVVISRKMFLQRAVLNKVQSYLYMIIVQF